MSIAQQKFLVHLTDEDRSKLYDIIRHQRGSAGRILRAKILLQADGQYPNINVQKIASLLNVDKSTVRRICLRYTKEGLRASVYASRFTKTVCLKEKERTVLHQILIDPESYKYNRKIANILLKADAYGNNADVSEIVCETGCCKAMVQKTIRSYLKWGLNRILKQENTFYFHLRKRDRIHLQNVLQQEVSFSWNYKRANILLEADVSSPEIVWDTVAKASGASTACVRVVCNKYMSDGLDAVLNLTSHHCRVPSRNDPVRLSAEEQSWLKNVIKTSCRESIRRRALILLNADENGQNLHNTDIVKLAQTHLETVRMVCKRYAERGLKEAVLCGCCDISKPILPKKTSQKPKIFEISLKPEERRLLQTIVESQSGTKTCINRAKILLQIDELHGAANYLQIASAVGVNYTTVYAACHRYLNEGIEAVVNTKSLRPIKKNAA